MMLHLRLEQMQVVFKRVFFQLQRFRRRRGEALGGGAEGDVDAVNVLYQVHHFIVRDVVPQPAAEFSGEVELAVGKRARAAETVHYGTMTAVDAVIRFAGNYRADAFRDGVALLDQRYRQFRRRAAEFVCGKNTRGTSSDYDHVVILHKIRSPRSRSRRARKT